MTLAHGVTQLSISADGRTLIPQPDRTPGGFYTLRVTDASDLGGGTLVFEESYQATASTATDADWETVATLDSLAVGYTYPIQLASPHHAVSLSGSTNAAVTLYIASRRGR